MSDSRVLTDIRDQYDSLSRQSFDPIIGIRDVYPLQAADVPMIRADFAALVPTGPVVPELILEIMEIEAWFIGEYTHFPRMHASLTPASVSAVLGYDPCTIDVSTIAWPCGDLRNIYASAGMRYSKSRWHS